ncbi:ribonuclease HI [Maricaulis salignorans]|uniref:ribonuclease HI n=1 Tax=Maricaulis salignorans TaxID=144026 RepID=UPI003A925DF6
MATACTHARKRIIIHTDGSCIGNPGPGGWACHITDGQRERLIAGGKAHATSSRMELLAAIKALEALRHPGLLVSVITDSNYVKDGITKWLPNWKTNGWRTSDKKPVKNADLWTRLDQQSAIHEVEWRWVRGHSGNPGNELVDRAAYDAAHRAAVEGDFND